MDLTDKQWTVLAPLLKPKQRADGCGRPWRDVRDVLNGVLWSCALAFIERWRSSRTRLARYDFASGAHDHPLSCAFLEEVHIDTLTAHIFSVPDSLFVNGAMGYGNVAEHLHVDWSKFVGDELVRAGFEIGENLLLGDDLAGAADDRPVIGVDLIELVDVDGHHCVAHVASDFLDRGNIAWVIERCGAARQA